MNCYCLIAICMLSAIASLPHAAIAEGQQTSQDEQVKKLEPFIGFWSGTTQFPDEPETRVMNFCRWAANKSYAKFELIRQDGEQLTHMATIIVGLSAKDGGLHVWSFWPDYQATGRATVEGSKLSFSTSGKTLDGASISSDVTYEVVGDEFRAGVNNRKRGDRKLPDIVVTLERSQRPSR